MVDIILSPRGTEILANATPNNLGLASLVRVYATANSTVTVAAANTDIIGSFTIPAGFVEIVAKDPTDTIVCSPISTLLCTSVAYR